MTPDDTTPESYESPLPEIIELDNDMMQVHEWPAHIQHIFCLRACGFSIRSIANTLKLNPATISSALSRFDPEGRFSLSDSEKNRFIKTLWQSRAAEALLAMTPEKIEAATLPQLTDLAHKAASFQLSASTKEKDPLALIDSLIKESQPKSITD